MGVGKPYRGARKLFFVFHCGRHEIPAASYRTPNEEFQKSAGEGAGTGVGKNGGAGRSAGTSAGRLGPLGRQPALFWNSYFGVLHQVAGISMEASPCEVFRPPPPSFFFPVSAAILQDGEDQEPTLAVALLLRMT